MERKWSLRAFKNGDEEGILELWKAVYPSRQYDREQWMRWWHWMYRDAPAGAGRIWLAENEGKIVGQYAIVPVVIKIGSENIVSAQSLDTMTHPDYRHQGIFETLAKAVYAEAQTDGIHIVYGFPNQLSYPGFLKKLNWFDIGTPQTIVKPLNWQNTLKMRLSNKFLLTFGAIGGNLIDKIFYRAKKAPIVEGLTITQVPSFDDRINEFWARFSKQYQIMIVRDKDYLNWRYVSIPDMDYSIYIAEKTEKIHGYLVLRCMQREHTKVGVICDILSPSEEIAQYLILKAIGYCKQEGVDLIQGYMIINKSLLKAFRRNSFISLPFIKGGPFIAYSSSPSISKKFLENPNNWFVQIGDSDIV